MTRLRRIALGIVGLAGIAATSARAGAIYTVTDEGTTSRPQVEYFNLTGDKFVRVGASGQISDGSEFGTYNFALPAGMRDLPTAPFHISPNGAYIVGTAFADPSPQAAWGGYVFHSGSSWGNDVQPQHATALGTLTGPSPGPYFSAAFGVSNAGTVVGESGPVSGPAGTHAISVDSTGKMTDLGSMGGAYTAALAINAQGAIVGEGQDSGGAFRAFITDGHALTDLNSLIAPIAGFTLVSATSINDAGQIAGYGHFATDPAGFYHEILLSPTSLGTSSLLPTPDPATDPTPAPNPQPNPIPEPTTIAFFALIAGAAGLGARRTI